MKTFHIFLIVLLAVSIIAFAFKGSCAYRPFSFSRSGLNMSNYEGFASKYNNGGIDYTGYNLGSNVPSQNSAEIENAYGKINGIRGLYGSPDAGERKDIFIGTKGTLQGPSYGYSNSMGFLQFNPEQLALLTSRGGNATGMDSQIGSY